MEIRLLGPLEAVDAGAPLALGGTKQRALLAALTLAGGRVVSAARLVDDLWGVRAPDTAPKMVQIHVSALRKVLPAGVLVTRAPGYAVDLPREAVDAFRAEDALRAGRDALAAGDPRGASEALAGALALWRGAALEEFGEPFADGEARRLAELRLALTEERLAADLALGRHADAIREIEALVAAEPLRERLRELQMVALYRSGRQAEALAAYQDAFRALNDELGLEPSARLRDLERAVLRQDPSLDAPAAAAAAPDPLTPPGAAPIGRDAELAALQAELAAAAEGATRVVLVTGEAGAGKTTLVDALLDGLPDGAALVGRGQCVVQHGPSEAYMPVLQALERICRAPDAGDALPALVGRAPTWVVQMPWLLDDAAREAVEARLVGANRDRMLREGVEAITGLSETRPVVLVVEDLQWSDLATVDLIAALARHRGPARLVLLATIRPPDAARDDAIHAAAHELVGRGLATELAVGGLGDAEVARYLASRLPGAELADDLAASMRARTGGIPLFLEKAVDGWIEDGRAVPEEGGWRLTADSAALSRDIPGTLRGLIRRRLDPLPPEDRRLLEAASVAAPAFSAALVAAALDAPEAAVEERIDALARAGVMLASAGEERWPDGTVAGRYAFTHDLCHEVLYDDLPAGRRARLHQAVGDRLERAHPDGRDEPSAELAAHFLRAGEPARAVRHLVGAAERAAGRLAPREALALAESALAAVPELPSPEREPWELRATLVHGLAVIVTSGWGAPEAERSFARARELAEALGQTEDADRATYRLATLHEVRGDYARSEELLRPMLAPGGMPRSRRLALDLQEVLACTLFHQGRFGDALATAEHGLELERAPVDPFLAAAGDDPVTACHHWAALSALHLGMPDEALRVSDRALALVAAPARRHAAASALALGAVVGQCLGDPARTRDLAERAIAEADERGYVYRAAMGLVLRGWARAALGDAPGGIAELRDGIARSRATGALMDEAYYLGLLADAYLRAGDADGARTALDEAREVVPRDGRFFHESELHRLRGEVALSDGDAETAERAMRRARDVARHQGARMPELRAALGLGAVLRATGRPTEARAAVAEVLGGFTEGFSSPDLRAATGFLAADGAEREPAAAPPVRYARSGDLSIAYEVTGAGPRDLVLVPGFISHLEQDRREPRHVRFLERLAGLGRLMRFDKRGTGLSDRPPGVADLEARMDDVRAVMDAAGSRRAVLVGYSEGCPMAVLFAATYPERVAGVVLIGGFAKRSDPDDDYPWAPTREEREAAIATLLGDGGLERMMRLMCPSADDAMAAWWGERCRAAASPGAIRALAEMNSLIDVRGVLPAVQAPTLVVHRTDDADVRVEEGRYLASRIPGATMVELPGADHFVAVDPDQLVDAIAPFVTGLADDDTAPEVAVATVVAAADGGSPLVQVYEGPVRAVREAVALARRLGRGVGVHTGPVRRAGRPEGDAVRIATAVAALAPPGEVLVTSTSRDLVPGSGLAFDPRGELAGEDGPRPLFAAAAPAPE